MPLEVRELVIKVTIEEQRTPPPAAEKTQQTIRRTLIRECVEEVLARLDRRAKR